jgi:hypothetical protein
LKYIEIHGKLVIGHSGFWFLVSGFWLLVSGFWFLVAGFWFLVTGCWLLSAGSGFVRPAPPLTLQELAGLSIWSLVNWSIGH